MSALFLIMAIGAAAAIPLGLVYWGLLILVRKSLGRTEAPAKEGS